MKTELISAVRSREEIVGGAEREKYKPVIATYEYFDMISVCRSLLNTIAS